MADVVQRVALVELVLVAQRLFRRGEDAEPLEALGEHLHRRAVGLHEVVARLARVERRALRFPDQLVDLALRLRERAADRQRARDVGRVERVALDAGVEQEQVAAADAAVVARPVQDAGVGAGGGDGAVADVVALDARAQVEDALDLALGRWRSGARGSRPRSRAWSRRSPRAARAISSSSLIRRISESAVANSLSRSHGFGIDAVGAAVRRGRATARVGAQPQRRRSQ